MGSLPDNDSRPPHGAWDSHVHVVDEERFPLHELHPYRPRKATVEDLQGFHDKIGIDHACIVAFSVYHDDNRSIVDALDGLKGKGRAVVCINPKTITEAELEKLHKAGARGIRINMRTTSGNLDLEALKKAAARVRPLKWVVQLYISMKQMIELSSVVGSLGVTIVLDHIGSPEPAAGPARTQPGYKEYMDLLRSDRVYTKLSGAYRFPGLPDLDEFVLDVLRTAPDRVVWASDWPHSGGVAHNPSGDRKQVQEYRKIDDLAWVKQCWSWCKTVEGGTGERLARKIWVDNPRRLWQYHGQD